MDSPEEVVKKASCVLADWFPVLKYHHIRVRGRWGIKDSQSRFKLGYTQQKDNKINKLQQHLYFDLYMLVNFLYINDSKNVSRVQPEKSANLTAKFKQKVNGLHFI